MEELRALDGLTAGFRFVAGDDNKDISPLHMAVRTVIIYAVSLALVRVGEKRFLGQSSAIDLIVGIMLGSIMSRAINAGAPLLPTCAAAAALVGLHWLMAAIAFRSDHLGFVFKGTPRQLVRDGQILWKEMARSHIGKHDLQGAARLNGRVLGLDQVREAHLERNGDVSVIPKQREPRVLEVRVEQGVQTIRIELDG